MEIGTKRKEFNLDEGIALPEEITYHRVEDTHLFIAPEKASYICTNDIGKRFLGLFKKGLNISTIISKLSPKYEKEKIISELRNFLIAVEKQGFYENVTVKEESEFKPVLQSYILHKCNIRCRHCFMDAGESKQNELSSDEWFKIIDYWGDLAKESRIIFTGGEPLLHPDLIQFVKRAKEKKLTVELFSNGTLINKEIAGKLAKYIDIIQLSLDGASPEVNDEIRGKGVFKKVVNSIDLFGKTNVKIRIAVIVMPQNADDIKLNIEKLVKSFPRDVEFKFGFATTEGRADKSRRFSPSYLGEIKLQEILTVLYKKKLKTMRKIEPNFLTRNCGYGMSISISSDGYIFPCAILRNSYGNVKENSLKDILEKMYRDRIATNIENLENCNQCDVRYFCYGGCRLNNLKYNKSLLKPYCPPGKKEDMYKLLVNRNKFDPVSIWIGN